MGFIDYVVEYFKGPPGADGAPGPTGPAGPGNVFTLPASGPVITIYAGDELTETTEFTHSFDLPRNAYFLGVKFEEPDGGVASVSATVTQTTNGEQTPNESYELKVSVTPTNAYVTTVYAVILYYLP